MTTASSVTLQTEIVEPVIANADRVRERFYELIAWARGVEDGARIRAYPAEAVLTKAQVAEWLQVSTKTVERLGIPRVRLGYRTPRYLAKHVLKFLDNGLDPAHRFLLGLDRKGGHDD